jgi:hypothetical protein
MSSQADRLHARLLADHQGCQRRAASKQCLNPMDKSREAYLPDAKSGLKLGRRCNAGREGMPVLTVVQDGSSEEEPVTSV